MFNKLRREVGRWSGKIYALAICTLLALIGLVGTGVMGTAFGAGIDVGANPTPKVDIAVTVPDDYPGTFLDFKQELTQKLLEQGMDPSAFRITNTDVSIDTTDLSSWIVYDHYRDSGTYNAIVPAAQRTAQPYRAADNTHTNGTGAIADYFKNNTNTSGNQCKNFDRHIYSSLDAEGKASMVFAGYGTQALSDFMIYPANSDSRRTIDFDINPAVIDTHTLASYGFLLNAGIVNGKITGYSLYFANNHVASIQKLDGVEAASGTTAVAGAQKVGNLNMGLTTGQTVRLHVELTKKSVTVQYQFYDAAGNLGDAKDLLRDYPLEDTGQNGFGPFVNYSSHGCSSLSIMKYSDLEMAYSASAFDALKNTQYYEGAQQKYFINLAGTNNNPQIPDEFEKNGEPNKDYTDGINRLNENEIFYISNAQDGKIVTDSKEENGKEHQGLGANNGFIAMTDDYVTEIAEWIHKGFVEGRKFDQAPIKSDLPLANFYLTNAEDDSQLMTVHLQHLVNTNGTIRVNMKDKSVIGDLSGDNGSLKKWHWVVYDPSNKVVVDKTYDDPSKIEDYVFTKDHASGRWTFELTVTDGKGNESKASQTYLTAYLDNEHPFIEGKNTGRNEATITLTDTGEGIDEDGITFISDGRGSGVEAYWVTDDVNATPTEKWEVLPLPQHQYSFNVDIENTKPIVIWVRDECGNIGNKAVFQPTRVVVQDADGNPIDDYYTIEEKPIIYLPEEDILPDPDDPEDKFAGWSVTPGGTTPPGPITEGSDVPKEDEHTIVIRPNYSKDQAVLIYLPNGGEFSSSDALKATATVSRNSSIIKDVNNRNLKPTRTGYNFVGWKYLKTYNNSDKATAETQAANAKNLEDVAGQVASSAEGNLGKVFVDGDYHYLVAQWEIAKNTVKLDANGGSLTTVRSFEDVAYDTDLGTLKLPLSGREIPSKPGYIFQGWSTTKNAMGDTKNTFKVAQGVSGITPVAAPKMGESAMTLYAVWKVDPNKFTVSFDSDGGSRVSDIAYQTSTSNKYTDNQSQGFTFRTPARPGYDFAGWYPLNEDGTMGTTRYTGTEAVVSKNSHTFKAKWTPRDDTKYTVEYWYNTGTKDANGNPVYAKVADSLTKTYTGTTEATATVAEVDKLSEVKVADRGYWYNPASTGNVLEGQITGSPNLVLKVCYDRYLDVNVIRNEGGSVTEALNQREGATPTVSWKADEGYKVSHIYVDGQVRDDLVTNEGSYTYTEPITSNHIVNVVFEKLPEGGNGGNGGSTPKPEPTKKRYSVSTKLNGCLDGSAKIDPTVTLEAGSNKDVTWSLGNYTMSGLMVDGKEIPEERFGDYKQDDGTYKVSFTGLAADHSVEVTVSKLPQNGGNKTEGFWTITVNKYGGDEKCEVSKSSVGSSGNYQVEWTHETDKYVAAKVVINGEEYTSTPSKHKRVLSFTKNQVVDIYYAPKPEDPATDPVIPDFSDQDEYVKVNTKIEGYTGDITPSAYIKKEENGANYTVDWTMKLKDNTDQSLSGELKDDGSPVLENNNYKDYTVVSVTVNGTEVTNYTNKETGDGGDLVLKNLNADADVVVKVKSEMVDVNTAVVPGTHVADVSKSVTVFKGQNYVNIQSRAKDSSYNLVEVLVNGKLCWNAEADKKEEVEDKKDEPESQSNEPVAQADDAAPAAEAAKETPKAEANAPKAEEKAAKDEADEPAAQTDEVVGTLDGDVETQADEVEKAPVVYRGLLRSSVRVAPGIYRSTNGASLLAAVAIDNKGAQLEVSDGKATLTGITEDQNVVFVYEKKGEYEGPKDGKSQIMQKYATVNVVVKDPDGQSIPLAGSKVITEEKGHDVNATWKVPTGWELVSVDGDTAYAGGSVKTFNNIQNDATVNVVLKRKEMSKPVEESYIKGDDPRPSGDNKYEVTTAISNGLGIIDGAGTYNKQVPDTVTWELTEPDKAKVYQVFVDGEARPDLVDANSITFDDGEDHHVLVVIKTGDETPTDIDKDGDGDPDINIDNDGDGEPDTNIDPDNDGTPDVNIDPDGDGDPDINVDTDGDGKPDTNIVDEDGDGKPDPIPDPKNPPKPNVNIDPDKDGKPDLNVDTNGDGKPDINIVDENHDGKPDPIDPSNPPKPNVNVDTNGDGKPDLNIDKDGDGKPDLNIVDKDGDGIADAIDVEKPPTPDVNVDTDGDGWPDINIDTDGDGKPDKNIDTNGDRVYDWKDEGHPNHQAYLDSLKGKTGLPNTGGSTTSTRSWSSAFGFLPKTGDVASMAGIAATLAGMALGATALVSRKRKK